MKKIDKKKFIDDCWITWYELDHGIIQYTCFSRHWTCPIGFVWGISAGRCFFVMNSYVDPYFRRRGVRTLLNKQIHEHNKIIQTQTGTKEGGKAFLKASGYKHDRVRNDWILVRSRKSQKKR